MINNTRMKLHAVSPAGCWRPLPGRHTENVHSTCAQNTRCCRRCAAGASHVELLVALLLLCSLPAAMAQTGIKLAWDPNTESTLAGYKVYFGQASRTYDTPIDVGNTTTYTLNVSGQRTYYIAVTAYDALRNESDFSNEVTAVIGSCAYSISPSSGSYGKEAASGSVEIATGAGCMWTAASNAPWVSITGGTSGIGSGVVNYLVQANSGSSVRSGTLTVAGQNYTVTQTGGSQCDLNGDGQVTAADVQILINALLGTGSCPGTCDLNHDGKIDAADLQLLTNVTLGKIACP